MCACIWKQATIQGSVLIILTVIKSQGATGEGSREGKYRVTENLACLLLQTTRWMGLFLFGNKKYKSPFFQTTQA